MGDEGDLSLVMSDYVMSLRLKKAINDLPGRAMTLGGMGRFYLYHKDGGVFKSNAQKAVAYFQEDERISGEIGDFTGQIKMPSFIGQIYARLGEYRKAADSFDKSRALARACGRDIDEVYALLGLHGAYVKLNMQKETKSVSHQLEKFHQKASLPEDLKNMITAAVAES